ncbi:MAG: hypothetical protein WAV47_12440 [Blastocatellia bacterium]
MTIRERSDECERDREDIEEGPDPSSGNQNLSRMRLAGQELLAAGADAIQKALSGNSESFLKATRQQGGE